MTRKRMVGPRSDGDFAMSIGMGGGRIRKGASVVKKTAERNREKPLNQKRLWRRKRKPLELGANWKD